MFIFFRLKEETTALIVKREKLIKVMEKHVIFQRYLDKVIENAEEFHEIREVIARHDTLTATHDVNDNITTFYHAQRVKVYLSLPYFKRSKDIST